MATITCLECIRRLQTANKYQLENEAPSRDGHYVVHYQMGKAALCSRPERV